MKKLSIYLVVIVMSSYLSVKSQTSTETCPGEKNYRWGVGVFMSTVDKLPTLGGILGDEFIMEGEKKDNSFSFGLTGQYLINEKTYIRFKTSITKRNLLIHTIDYFSESFTITSFRLKQTTQRFSTGILWKIRQNKFAFIGGFEIIVSFFDDYNSQGNSKTFTNNVLIQTGSSNQVIEGGFSSGLGGFIGFCFLPIKNLSVGMEFSEAFLYSKIGGIVKSEFIQKDAQGNIINTNASEKHDSIKKFSISNFSSIFFNYIF